MKIGKYSIEKKSKLCLSSILGYAALAAVGYFVVKNLPDLKRYLKITTM